MKENINKSGKILYNKLKVLYYIETAAYRIRNTIADEEENR